MSRRNRKTISESTPQPLAIIAGLPAPNHNAVAKEITARFTKWKVISTPFPRGPASPYGDAGAILELAKEVCRFAENESEKTPPRPGRLVLFYTMDAAFARLLDVFGFSALAIPIQCENWHWPQGRHWRSDPDVVIPMITSAINRLESEDGNSLKIRLERTDSDDVLLLPPRNFHMSNGTTLFSRFDACHKAGTICDMIDHDISSEVFTIERLPTFFKNTGEVSKSFRIDQRGLVFAISRRGQHGPARMMNVSSIEALSDFRPLLESLYRFGTPLRSGFQHDVQWEDDRHLASVEFADIDQPIKLSQSHANIYANDRVR